MLAEMHTHTRTPSHPPPHPQPSSLPHPTPLSQTIDWAKEHLPAEELVVVVKPDAVEKVDDIVKALEGAGFAVTERKEMENMAPEMAQTLLGAESPEDPAVAHLCSGKSVALAVSQLAGIAKMAALCGPASVEAAKADAPDRFVGGLFRSLIERHSVGLITTKLMPPLPNIPPHPPDQQPAGAVWNR